MDQGEEMEEMWLFQGLEHSQSQEYGYLSKKPEESIEEEINQFFSIKSNPEEQVQTVQLEALNSHSSKPQGEGRILRTRKPVKRNFINSFKIPDNKSKNKRKITPSPYHNYQKHLIIAIKHILQPPQLTFHSSNIINIEHLLWKAFMENQNQTKKILYFIFNEQNEYEISIDELRSFGLEEIYQHYSTEEISIAKSLMTQLALEQLTQDSIDHYLSTRRIKDPNKFKRYIDLFVHELEEGFIKKRLSNRHRHPHRSQISQRQA